MLAQYRKYSLCCAGILCLLLFSIIPTQAEPIIGKVTSIAGQYTELDIVRLKVSGLHF